MAGHSVPFPADLVHIWSHLGVLSAPFLAALYRLVTFWCMFGANLGLEAFMSTSISLLSVPLTPLGIKESHWETLGNQQIEVSMVKLCGLKNKTKFAPWLAAICRNVAKDMVTARRKQVCSENIWQAVEDKAGGDEQAETVRNAIEKLAAAERELVVLRYYNSLSYEQISAVLGISKPAINGRLKRAKRKLAKFLRDSGLPEERL